MDESIPEIYGSFEESSMNAWMPTGFFGIDTFPLMDWLFNYQAGWSVA
jgi:hypothetical protein